ncbi:MAG: hypothetical protein ABIQ57_17665 [Candidatus Kapaibacterium sp.]
MDQQTNDANVQAHHNTETQSSPDAPERDMPLSVTVTIEGLAGIDFPFALELGFAAGPSDAHPFTQNSTMQEYMVDNPADLSSANIIMNNNIRIPLPFPPQLPATKVDFPSGPVYVSLGLAAGGRFLRVIVSTAHGIA